MIKLSLTRLAVAIGGSAITLAAATGVASASPDLGPAVNTTCSYPQVVSALGAQGPEAVGLFNQNRALQLGLQQFLVSGPAKRQQMAQQLASAPAVQPYLPAVEQAFLTCNNF
jgi:hemophore-related protein